MIDKIVAKLPRYSPHGSSYATPSAPAAVKERATGRRGSSATKTAADTERMAAAVANWAEESNGQIEARTFTLAEPRELLPDMLLRLRLRCLKEAKPKFWTAVTTPASAVLAATDTD